MPYFPFHLPHLPSVNWTFALEIGESTPIFLQFIIDHTDYPDDRRLVIRLGIDVLEQQILHLVFRSIPRSRRINRLSRAAPARNIPVQIVPPEDFIPDLDPVPVYRDAATEIPEAPEHL